MKRNAKVSIALAVLFVVGVAYRGQTKALFRSPVGTGLLGAGIGGAAGGATGAAVGGATGLVFGGIGRAIDDDHHDKYNDKKKHHRRGRYKN